MTDTVIAGNTIVLDAQYINGDGDAVVPTTPLVSIHNPDGVLAINNAVPTSTASTGRYEYAFLTPALGPYGTWTSTWTGIIDGQPFEASGDFLVVVAQGPGSDVITDGPCSSWPVDLSCANLPDDVDQAVIESWQAVATKILWSLSGRRWGTCTRTVRPCRRSCLDPYTIGHANGRLFPYIDGGVWRNAVVCGCGSDCSCGQLCEVYLPGPVNSITEVTIDGAVIDPAEYRVDAPGMLVRQGDECWPSCQDMSAAAGEDNTFVVTYEWGLTLDAAAIAAVSELTAELVKACTPSCKDCRLSRRVTQVAQQGMVAQFIDPQDFLENGLTGLYLVDLWLTAVNPDHLPAPMRVRSPDFKGPRTTLIT